MTYAVFKYDTNCEVKDRIKTYSFIMFTPESQLSGFDFRRAELYGLNLSTNKVGTLEAYLACCEAKVQYVSIIKLPEKLTTDEYLLSFGDAYLGCISVKLKKDELIKRVELYKKLERTNSMFSWLTVNLDYEKDRIKRNGVTISQIKELKALQTPICNLIDKWTKVRQKPIVKSIEQLPKFLKRGF